MSYRNPANNRYRYKLEPLENAWHEVGSDERLATYTTLPAGVFTFRAQAVTSRGAWSEPRVKLEIEILSNAIPMTPVSATTRTARISLRE